MPGASYRQGRFRVQGAEVEAIHFGAYTEALAGGPVARWLGERGIAAELKQHDPGPAYLRIASDPGAVIANVGDWIVYVDRTVGVVSYEVFMRAIQR